MADITTRFATSGLWRPKVYTKTLWSDEAWTLQPYLYPIDVMQRTGPELGQCSLQYRYGPAEKRHDLPGAATYAAVDLSRKYCKVVVEDTYNPNVTETVFYGIIDAEATTLHAHDEDAGVQIFTAYDLKYHLARYTHNQFIYQFRENNVALQSVTTDALSFNYHAPVGPRNVVTDNAVAGNRANGVHWFGNDPATNKLWSIIDIIDYVLDPQRIDQNSGPFIFGGILAPDPYPFDRKYMKVKYKSDGLEAVLDTITPVVPAFGRTDLDIINEVLSRRNGVVWWMEVRDENFAAITDDDTQEYMWIVIDSIYGAAYTVFGVEWPANSNRVPFTIPQTHPHTHWVTLPRFDYSLRQKYDAIVVQGQPIKVTATFTVRDETLAAGWTAADEAAYIAGGNGATAELKDEFRTAEKFRDVYASLIVPYTWDAEVGTGVYRGVGEPAAYATWANVLPDASVEWILGEDNTLRHYMTGKVFDRQTCLMPSMDYTGNGEELTFPTEPTDYMPLFALIKNRDGRCVFLDKLNDDQSQEWLLPSTNVTPHDNRMGVRFGMNPAHILARNDFTSEVTFFDADAFGLDWRDIAVTATFPIGRRQHVFERITETYNDDTDAILVPEERTLFVTMTRAEYWYLMADTIVDINDDGTPKVSGRKNGDGSGHALRDDKLTLRQAMAMLKEWFTNERQAMQIVTDGLSISTTITAPLGAYVTDIVGATLRKSVNAFVTAIRLDFRNQTTTTETDFASLQEVMDRLT